MKDFRGTTHERVLRMLIEETATAAEVAARLDEHGYVYSPSSVCSILSALREAGLIHIGPRARHQRNLYQISDAGRAAIVAWDASPIPVGASRRARPLSRNYVLALKALPASAPDLVALGVSESKNALVIAFIILARLVDRGLVERSGWKYAKKNKRELRVFSRTPAGDALLAAMGERGAA